MIWCTGQANLIGRSTSQTSMDIDNDNIGNPENLSLPNEKGSAKIKQSDQMVKTKAKSEILPCNIPKESVCFYCQEKIHWL